VRFFTAKSMAIAKLIVFEYSRMLHYSTLPITLPKIHIIQLTHTGLLIQVVVEVVQPNVFNICRFIETNDTVLQYQYIKIH